MDVTNTPAQSTRRETRCLKWSNIVLGALIPLMIGIGTVVITLQQQKSEDRRFQQTQDNEDRRFRQTQDNEDRRRKQDQKQMDDLHYQDVYKTYISDISNAIFKQPNESPSFVNDRTRLDYIRSQTLTTLVDLDCQRKTWLFQFLHENKLLPRFSRSTSLNLTDANLSCVRITKSRNSKRFELKALVLSSVDLTNASFIGLDFDDGVDFSRSAMENMKFTRSTLRSDSRTLRVLFEYANLAGADFSEAWLSNASFRGADLSHAIFTAVTFYGGAVDLTETDLTFTTFKDFNLSPPTSMSIINANMTGALILEQKWFTSAVNQVRIQMMNVILPNGTWLLNEAKNFVENGNAELNCTTLLVVEDTKIPYWHTFNLLPNITLPTLSIIGRNDSSDNCYFDFSSVTADKPISLGQLVFVDKIKVFIQSSEVEYHLSFDIAGCQGGCLLIVLTIFSSATTPSQSVFCVNGTDELHWQKRAISERIRVNTDVIQAEIARVEHKGLCYVDNVEFYVRRSGSKK